MGILARLSILLFLFLGPVKPLLADGIEVLSPTRPFFPLGQRTVVQYRFSDAATAPHSDVLIFIHPPDVPVDRMGGYGLLWDPTMAALGHHEAAEVQPDGSVRIPVTLFESMPVGEMRVISVVDNTSVWGSTEPFEIISHIGDGGDWDVGGRAVFLTHPRGGESWQRDHQYVISWVAHGVGFPSGGRSTAQYRIQFLRGGRGLDTYNPSLGPLHWCEPEEKRCFASWKVPDDLAWDGDEITVRLTTRETGHEDIVVESRPFSIRAGGITLQSPRPPSDRGETFATPAYHLSNTWPVRWLTGFPTRDRVENTISVVEPDGTRHELTTHTVDGTGNHRYSWKIGEPNRTGAPVSSLAPGSGYRIRIHQTDDPGVWDESVPIDLYVPTIDVDVPDRGPDPDAWAGPRNFYPDETVRINWSGDGFQPGQRLNAWVVITDHSCAWSGEMQHWIAGELSATGGAFDWEIGTLYRASHTYDADYWVYTDDCFPLYATVRLELEEYREQIFSNAAEQFSINRRR